MKAVNAVIEIMSGLLLFFTGTINAFIIHLAKGERFDSPFDFAEQYILTLLPRLSVDTKFLVIFYLLAHGLMNIFLFVSLLRNKLWAYPVAIVFSALFMAYQLYRFTISLSLFLIVLTIFDAVLIRLTWHEYSLAKKHLPLE